MRGVWPLALIVLHSVTGQPILVNPDLVTSLRGRSGPTREPMFPRNAQCLVYTADGKWVTVTETCAEVREMIEAETVPPREDRDGAQP